MLTGPTRLEVWGDPIDHSLSPRLHAAAYARLGWDWTYGRRRVDAAGFAAEVDGLDASYRGLSLTFPLKAAAFAAATTRDRPAELTLSLIKKYQPTRPSTQTPIPSSA